MNKVYLILGPDNVEAFDHQEYEDIDVNDVHEYEFKTTDEKVAFCKGIQLTAEYENYTFIDEDEYKTIINAILN